MRLLRRQSESLRHENRHTIRSIVELHVPRVFAWVATTVYRLASDRRGWRPALTRTSAHFAVIAVAILVVGLSNIEWSARAAASITAPLQPAVAGDNAPALQDAAAKVTLQELAPHASVFGNEAEPIIRRAQPRTVVPERPRLGVVTYTVQAGDTVQGIAALFGLDPTTLLWSNPDLEDAPDLLRIGQEMRILPLDGVYHKIAEGDSLESIAEEYKVEVDAIVGCEYNALESRFVPLPLDTYLIVPGGEKPYIAQVVTAYAGDVPIDAYGSGQFQWPVLGVITQGYWYGHRAVDVGAPIGSALLASDGGYISFAGWTDVGYGYLVVIDHNNGYSTYYGHCSNIYVFEGQVVEQGQVIAAVGNTGWSTGPHLHFEIRYSGVPQNPFAYLP
ncbi:MAG: M23 family metallopeptidase [Anaerolineae bacterium]|nr:M23 family metallopeptidase [Anaerolineae bacterium]